uniref:Uncharacterized protein n=1 Tax=Kalanchoe fedtschenkoi TaxID=63787 RepID=A0A7N0UMZ3_KALFE
MAARLLNSNTSNNSNIIMAVVSKIYCSPDQSLLVVRRRPHMVMGGGFVVTDCSQRTLFRVDGCGVIGKMGEVVLRDGQGHPLLLLQRKEGLVQVLHVHRQWRGFTSQYEGSQKLAFVLKDPKSCFPFSNAIKISTQPRMNTVKDWDFEIRGYFPDKDCSIIDHQGSIVAQIGVRLEMKELMTTQDLYHVVVSAGIDQAFVVGIIAVLDSIYGESTIC